jgi:hypothetical protein
VQCMVCVRASRVSCSVWCACVHRVSRAVYGVRACIVCRVQCSVRSVWWVQCRVGAVCVGLV